MLLRALTPLFAMGCLSSGEGKPFGSDSGAPILEDPNPTDDSGEPSDTGSDDVVDPAPSLTVSRMGMVSHLTALMEIAEANGGNRSRRYGGLRRLGGLCDCSTGGRRVHGDHIHL